MENIFPLILIIIVFNVINAILKAFKGAKGSAGKVSPPPYNQPGQKVKINPWVDDGSDQFYPESDHGVVEPEARGNAVPITSPPLPEKVYRIPPAQKVEPARAIMANADSSSGYDGIGQSVTPAKVLASENAFLNAFIFYEILQPPVSMRKKH